MQLARDVEAVADRNATFPGWAERDDVLRNIRRETIKLLLRSVAIRDQRTRWGNATRLVRPRTVTGDGEGLVSRGGLVWLGEVADRSGLTGRLSLVLADVPRRRHDPGVGLAQLVVALADGAECLSDLDPCARSRSCSGRWRPGRARSGPSGR